ncbi:hypothetical protein WUBG_04865, partial [Wuchereria bancrofti]
ECFLTSSFNRTTQRNHRKSNTSTAEQKKSKKTCSTQQAEPPVGCDSIQNFSTDHKTTGSSSLAMNASGISKSVLLANSYPVHPIPGVAEILILITSTTHTFQI